MYKNTCLYLSATQTIKNHQSTKVKFYKNTVPTLSQEKILGNEMNKAYFIVLLKTLFLKVGSSNDQAESNADTFIVHFAPAASQFFDSVTVVAEDIGILILLTTLGRKQF